MKENQVESENFNPSQINTFEGFKDSALRIGISKFEKIGFPDNYRSGYEQKICEDISKKLKLKTKQNQKILDIGSGCSDLPGLILQISRENNHQLTLLDSAEMHSNLPGEVKAGTTQIDAQFPKCVDFINQKQKSFDSIICYSVIQYAFIEDSIFGFLDSMMALLKPGGRILIGDIPNISMKKRFLGSESGENFNKNFFGHTEKVSVNWNSIEEQKLDDAVVLSLIMRARAAGFHAYLMPQDEELPLSNRREDLLIVKP